MDLLQADEKEKITGGYTVCAAQSENVKNSCKNKSRISLLHKGLSRLACNLDRVRDWLCRSHILQNGFFSRLFPNCGYHNLGSYSAQPLANNPRHRDYVIEEE